jgi:hypothetical protein
VWLAAHARFSPPQKVERLSASLHLVGARPAGKRTVFVEDGCGDCIAHALLLPLLADAADTAHARRARRSEEALAVMPGAVEQLRGGGGAASDESDSDAEDGRAAHAPQSARGYVPSAAARLTSPPSVASTARALTAG